MFDIAKTGIGGASMLKDLWVGYQLSRSVRLEVGQQKTGLRERPSNLPDPRVERTRAHNLMDILLMAV